MAKSDILVRWKADTSNYDQNMAKAKRQLDSFARDNYTAGGACRQLTSQIVSSAAKFASYGAAIAGAMKVAKDAFMSSEQNLDAWGRAVASSESLYKGFLNAINSGDISGYLSNISQITKAASEAYDALDELATYKAFNRVNMAKARTGYTEAVADFREGKGTKEAVQQASEKLIKELRETYKLQQNAYEKSINELAQQRQVSEKDLRTVLSGTYGDYKSLKEVQFSGKQGTWIGGGGVSPKMEYVEYPVAANEKERLADAMRKINDTELDALQALGETAQMTLYEINNQRKQVARILNGSRNNTVTKPAETVKGLSVKDFGGLSFGVTTSMQQLMSMRSTYQRALYTADNMFDYNEAQKAIDHVQELIDAHPLAMKLGIDVEQAATKIRLDKQLDSQLGSLKPLPVYQEQQRTLSKEDFDRMFEMGQKVTSGMTGIISGIQQMGIALPDSVMQVMNGIQGLMSIINGVETILSVFSSSTITAEIASTTANTAATTALTTAVLANTSALMTNSATNALPFFARGGIPHAFNGFVPGNDHTDNIPVMVSSGELILNKAQSGILAAELTDRKENKGGGGLPYTNGENMFLAVNNYLRRSGRGEIMTTRR